MPNRTLNADELKNAQALLNRIRKAVLKLAGDDPELLFAYRRKIAKELGYDERGKPMHRRLIKAQKFVLQKGKCAKCKMKLPTKNAVLDRLTAFLGYTLENTRLLCVKCDQAVQAARGYR